MLVPDTGDPEYFEKGYEPYRTNWTDDSEYYLGLTKAAVANATTDATAIAKAMARSATAAPVWSARCSGRRRVAAGPTSTLERSAWPWSWSLAPRVR